MLKKKIKPYRRCERCGSPIIYGGRGPYPKYCNICKRRRCRERNIKWIIKKRDQEKRIFKNINKYIDYPKRYDGFGNAYIDETHTNWDTFIQDGICIKRLGTVSEWDLDKREYELRKKHGLLKNEN